MNLVFEIGTEELPASSQRMAVDHMSAEIKSRYPAASIRTFATPRRLAVLAGGLPEGSKDETKEVTGPPANAPEKAREGFAKKSGVPVAELREKNGRLVATVTTRGVATADVLPRLLETIIRNIPFKRTMRWDALEGDPFARPVHWIVATLDGKVVPVSFADVQSGDQTRGHRFHSSGTFGVANYVETLREHHVLADWDERKQRVAEEVAKAARDAGGVPRPDDDLLETVTGLVEEPYGVHGTFDRAFLELPPEVLVSEMRGHQKYFAVQDERGELLPAFVAVSNTRVKDPAVSRKGYERVLRARLSDGKFFFDEDRRHPLRSRVEKLGRRTFMDKLGTELERVGRIRELALWLHGATGQGDAKLVSQAAELCKADLTTGMVGEFPELQGAMGRVYALKDGEPPEVAEAIFEHYLPRGAEERLPQTHTGALLGMADRLDLLAGLFGLGKEPTGTADPYGLRRAALGLLRVTLAKGYRFDMGEALFQAHKLHYFGRAKAASKIAGGHVVEPLVDPGHELPDRVWQFLLGRLEVLLRDKGQSDSIQAVLHTGARDVVALEKRLVALHRVREERREQFEAAAAAFKRIANIVAQAQQKKITIYRFQQRMAKRPAEIALAQAFEAAQSRVADALEREEYIDAYSALAEIRPVVDQYFDAIMVMDPDPIIREHRVALLAELHMLFAPLADFSRLQVEKTA
ncbi:MAG TPA: glycine--tRNA ligase subunit beta [Myxococcales bacterium]|nr:glycine--tRNA ligase subunit beta [Myxococcales bacterium]